MWVFYISGGEEEEDGKDGSNSGEEEVDQASLIILFIIFMCGELLSYDLCYTTAINFIKF